MARTWPYLLGRNLSIALTPQSIAADGTLTDHTVGTFTFEGLLDEAEGGSLSLKTENISAMDDFSQNPVPYEKSVRYSISELSSAIGTDGNLLYTAMLYSFYWKIVFTLWDNNPTSTAGFFSETAYVLCTEFDPSYRKNKAVARATCELLSIWDANPSY